MYKVLLVDDERMILDGIAMIIDWKTLGVQLIGKEKNGLDALNFMEKYQPDIVITDITMPGLDGLGLVAKCTELYPDIKWIFISGYNEFEYARKAMRYGVKHYLLKPCNEQQISEALTDVIKEKENEEKAIHFLQNIKDEAGNLLFSEKEDILKQISQRAMAHNRRRTQKYSKVIQQIIDYIHDELDNPNLSLQWLANEHLFMNADYLGKTFKKEVGQRFSSYVTNARMNCAVEMIEKDPDIKVFELAEKLGFGTNPQYFSQLFKRIKGVTPSEILKSLD
ncbi:response regulator [Gracilibacillus sp. YIM 98692]|uniref:response regulator transcription factor n=1 Tax=Gracilibacillus sp. YIM 98692 TaxID=2663532 RepID=UPI0013D8DA4F|nr:response regulator [Gracilibacillus sp. YIM 98692]